MSQSPQARTINSLLEATKTMDLQEIQSHVTESFAIDFVDENNTVHKFTRNQLIRHMAEQIKPICQTVEVVTAEITQTQTDDVRLESEVIMQPTGHHVVFSASYKFIGDKVDKIILRTKAATYEVLRFQYRAA